MTEPRSTTIQTADGPLYVREGDIVRFEVEEPDCAIEGPAQIDQYLPKVWAYGEHSDGKRVRILRPVLIYDDKVDIDPGFYIGVRSKAYEVRDVREDGAALVGPVGLAGLASQFYIDAKYLTRLPPEPTPAPQPEFNSAIADTVTITRGTVRDHRTGEIVPAVQFRGVYRSGCREHAYVVVASAADFDAAVLGSGND